MMNTKKALMNRLSQTNRGLTTDSATQAALELAIAQLESENPTEKPLESEHLMGDWRLIYTTSQGILGLDRIPLTDLGEVYQCLRGDALYNVAETQGALGVLGVVAVGATYEVVSPVRVQVTFRRSILGLQRVMGYRSVAEFVERLERRDRLWAVDFPIPERETGGRGWLEVTYLDADMRIGRGNEGSIFVLVKD
jgi:PAP_fibrillin